MTPTFGPKATASVTTNWWRYPLSQPLQRSLPIKYIEAGKGRIEVLFFAPGATVTYYHVCRKEVRRGDSSCLWHCRIEWKDIDYTGNEIVSVL